jgi:hypothetical protein
LKYKDPFIVNKDIKLNFDPLFVYVDFVRPGKHTYIIDYAYEEEPIQSIHHIIVPPF